MFSVAPSPDPSSSRYLDPFGPTPVDQFPPAPGWLFPMVIAIASVAFAGIAVLLVMWSMARRKAAAQMIQSPRRDWIDLNEFDPKGDPRRPKSPIVTRADGAKKPTGKSPKGDA